jgi:probable HAF family extracellular repeat protein
MTDLGTLGGTGGYATGINDAGKVVGWSNTSTGNIHGFVSTGGTLTDLGALGGNKSLAIDINNVNQIVGNSSIVGGTNHATLWNNGTLTDLGTLSPTWSGANSYAQAINDAGQVVGYSNVVGISGTHAALWSLQNGTMVATDLNSFLDASTKNAWTLTTAYAINNKGAIVGQATNNITHATDAFLLSVGLVPEPQSYAMMLAGLGLMGFIARRRKQNAA